MYFAGYGIATCITNLSPCVVMFGFSFLRREKHHNRMTTSNSTVIQKMTPITAPAMIPIEEPPPLSLLLPATVAVTVLVAIEVVGVTVVADTIEVVSLVDIIEVVSLVDTIEVVSLVDTIEVISLVDTIEVVSLVDTIEIVSLVDTIEIVLLIDTIEGVLLVAGTTEVVNNSDIDRNISTN